ncbi:hypothetical protein HN51_021132 [Arachis hypogaea]
MEFEFERRRITKEDVRELIYCEIPEICPDLFTSNGELKEQPVQQKFSKQSTDAQSQHAPRSNTEYELPREDSAGYSLTAKHALLDGEENLKNVDSFSR